MHLLTHINVPKLNSIYQSCCIECIIYIHKWSFILILNYILCFKEMHCLNRIKCYGWIDSVTFLHHPDSWFPLMLMMMLMECMQAQRGTHHEKEVDHMRGTVMVCALPESRCGLLTYHCDQNQRWMSMLPYLKNWQASERFFSLTWLIIRGVLVLLGDKDLHTAGVFTVVW